MLICQPEVREPFDQLGRVILVEQYVGKVGLQQGTAGVPCVEEHQFCLAEMHWCQSVP